MRLPKTVILVVLTLFLLPIAVRATLMALQDQAHSWQDADLSSMGILPPATSHPDARILIMWAQVSGLRGSFATHSWVVLKRESARSWSRYDVVGWSNRGDANGGAPDGRWFGNSPVLNRWMPDGRWFGNHPTLLVDVSGAEASALIPKIEAAIEAYEANAGRYRFWPGPNSNTFVAAVLRAVPELEATLPPTAIGKDFRPGPFLGLTDSRTGFEASLWGVLGVKIGWVEGLELNLFSLVAGLDLRRPGVKLPGFGRVGFGQDAPLPRPRATITRAPLLNPPG
jgi:hypothetical protein